MPAVDNLVNAGNVAPQTFGAKATGKNPERFSTGDDFDRAMNAALAPASQKPPQRPGKNQAKTETDANSEVSLRGKISEDKPIGATGAREKDELADGKNLLAANASTITTASTEPVPGFLSLSFYPCFAASAPVPGENSAAGKNGTAEVVPPGASLQLAVNTQPATLNSGPADANGDAEKPATKPKKSPLLKSLSPVTEAEAAALEKNLSTDADPKNSSPDSTPLKPETKNTPTETLAAALPEAISVQIKSDSTLSADTKAAAGKFESSPSALADGTAEKAGTEVAITALTMKNSQKTNKVAGPAVKVLPVGENGMAREKNLPTTLLATPVRAADDRGADLNFAFSNGSSNSPLADFMPVLNVADLPSLADARMRALERAQDMVALHAMRLVESKSDTLSVVIKPAVGMELSLELRERNGGVEAQATLTRGEHQFLSQHWPELQQRLELRGIKLAPLGGETNFSAGDGGSFQHGKTSREDAAQQAAAFAEFASAGAAGGATARLAVIHDGWESWA